jgi:hypothetical protein
MSRLKLGTEARSAALGLTWWDFWLEAEMRRALVLWRLCVRLAVWDAARPLVKNARPHILNDLVFVWTRRPVLENKNTKAPTLVLLRVLTPFWRGPRL